MVKFSLSGSQEDKHTAYKNPFVFTIIRSLIINILMLNGVTKVQEQITNNQFDFMVLSKKVCIPFHLNFPKFLINQLKVQFTSKQIYNYF
jgi:hypothetical protein